MNITDKQHNYHFQTLNEINSTARIYVNTINSRSYDLGSYDKTLIIVHEFMYKHDYMMNLINEIVKLNTRVIVFDLTGHNCVSESYKQTLLKMSDSDVNNSIDSISYIIPNDYKINSKFQSKVQNYYDFINFDNISFLTKILDDYGFIGNKNENIFILSHSIGSLSVF